MRGEMRTNQSTRPLVVFRLTTPALCYFIRSTRTKVVSKSSHLSVVKVPSVGYSADSRGYTGVGLAYRLHCQAFRLAVRPTHSWQPPLLITDGYRWGIAEAPSGSDLLPFDTRFNTLHALHSNQKHYMTSVSRILTTPYHSR